MEIRHIAAARDAPIIAIGAWKSEVEVWNAESATKVSSFLTQLEPGGQRLAISHDGTHVAAGPPSMIDAPWQGAVRSEDRGSSIVYS